MVEAVTDDDFDRLLAAHLDDALDAADAARFQERLRTDADARRRLLAAATQASALPRLGLEAAVPRRIPSSRTRWWLPVTTAAAALLITAVGWWSTTSTVTEPEVRLAGGSALVERGDRALATPGAVQAGDRVSTGIAPVALRWPGEDTRIDLAGGSRLHVEKLGRHTVLRLDQGGLSAAVASQPADGGLVIVTPHGRVEVVGTRFEVQVQEHGSRVAVTHGRVRMTSSSGGPSVLVEAGYVAEVTSTTVSSPGPAMVLPPEVPAPVPPAPAAPSSSVRLTAADFTGGEGVVEEGVVRAVAVDGGRVMRLMTPTRRPGGYARLSDHLRCSVRLSVDRPTTLALLLVCDQPGGGAMWTGNLQAERAIPAGTHEIVFTRADLRLATGTLPGTGSRVIAVAVMCWSGAADLRLEALTIAE